MKLDGMETKFMEELAHIKAVETFFGVARILKVKLYENELDEQQKPVPRKFEDILVDIVASYKIQNRKRRRELYQILKQSNKAKIPGSKSSSAAASIDHDGGNDGSEEKTTPAPSTPNTEGE